MPIGRLRGSQPAQEPHLHPAKRTQLQNCERFTADDRQERGAVLRATALGPSSGESSDLIALMAFHLDGAFA